jgi:hypothetical protein
MEWFTVEVQYQWESADANGGRVDEGGAVAKGDAADPSKVEVAPLTQAA